MWPLSNPPLPSVSGKDQFPAELPEFVLKVFERLLPKSVQATVESYDGSANVLSLITQTDSGRGHLTSAILDALKAQDKSSPSTPRAQEAKQADRKASAPHVLPWATAGTKAMVPTVSPASPQRASQPPQLSRPAPPPAAAAPPPPLVYGLLSHHFTLTCYFLQFSAPIRIYRCNTCLASLCCD